MNGQELREARLREGWTQQQAAGRLGVTQAYLSMVERGHRVLPSVLARKAVEMLHASPTALPLREEGSARPATAISSDQNSQGWATQDSRTFGEGCGAIPRKSC